MIAGGAESCIHPLAIGGFARSRSLATNWNDTPAIASRPFDKGRAGFVIGEGAACVVLEVRRRPQHGNVILLIASTRNFNMPKLGVPKSTQN